MAFFFRPYPTIGYRIPGSTKTIGATNITRRFSIANFINNARVTFDEYYVKDGERPDTVAYDYYDDPTMDWLILLTNEIHDPYYEWPLGEQNFIGMLLQKYKGLSVNGSPSNGSDEATYSYINQKIHHYEQIIQTQKLTYEADGTQRIIPEKTLVVDQTTYNALPASQRKAVSIYEHEVALNEKRRLIYLLDMNYLQLIKEQHPYIFDEGSPTR